MSIDIKEVYIIKIKRLLIANENLIPYIYNIIYYFSISFFLSSSLVSQRLAYILSYFCMVSNILVITIFTPIKFLLRRTTFSIKITILSLISLSLISGDLYKSLFREQYTERRENIEEGLKIINNKC